MDADLQLQAYPPDARQEQADSRGSGWNNPTADVTDRSQCVMSMIPVLVTSESCVGSESSITFHAVMRGNKR